MISSIKFIDTNLFVRRWDDQKIEDFIDALNPEEYCTSVLVLIETYHKLQSRHFTENFDYIRSLMGVLTVFDIIQDDFFNAIKNPLDIDINDRVHLAVMKRNNINTIISYDTDFDKEKSMVREEL